MTKRQKELYREAAQLRKLLSILNGKKFKLDCGHHVTFGCFLGNDVIVRNGKKLKIICVQCGY
jgi:hypothetical protein